MIWLCILSSFIFFVQSQYTCVDCVASSGRWCPQPFISSCLTLPTSVCNVPVITTRANCCPANWSCPTCVFSGCDFCPPDGVCSLANTRFCNVSKPSYTSQCPTCGNTCPSCSYPQPTLTRYLCQNGGKCEGFDYSSYSCECTDTHYGPLCNSSCDCNGHGKCLDGGQCDCYPGYYADNCSATCSSSWGDHPYCDPKMNCSGQGKCNDTCLDCVCDPLWTGEDCSTTVWTSQAIKIGAICFVSILFYGFLIVVFTFKLLENPDRHNIKLDYKSFGVLLEMFSIIIEAFQFAAFTFKPSVPWPPSEPSRSVFLVSIIDFGAVTYDTKWTLCLTFMCFYLFFALSALGFYGFKKSMGFGDWCFDCCLGCTALFSKIATIAFIPIIQIFLSTLVCGQYAEEIFLRLIVKKEVICWEKGSHSTYLAITFIILILYYPVSLAILALWSKLNSIPYDLRFLVLLIQIKLMVSLVGTFFQWNTPVFLLLSFIFLFILFVSNWKMDPCMDPNFNFFRQGLFGWSMWVILCGFIALATGNTSFTASIFLYLGTIVIIILTYIYVQKWKEWKAKCKRQPKPQNQNNKKTQSTSSSTSHVKKESILKSDTGMISSSVPATPTLSPIELDSPSKSPLALNETPLEAENVSSTTTSFPPENGVSNSSLDIVTDVEGKTSLENNNNDEQSVPDATSNLVDNDPYDRS